MKESRIFFSILDDKQNGRDTVLYLHLYIPCINLRRFNKIILFLTKETAKSKMNPNSNKSHQLLIDAT